MIVPLALTQKCAGMWQGSARNDHANKKGEPAGSPKLRGHKPDRS